MSRSDETDPNIPIAFSRECIECGYICAEGAAAAQVPAGPIRLLQGVHGVFGLVHIEEPGRLRAIQGRGFSGGKAFVFAVASNWTHLHKGDNGRLTAAIECAGGFNAIVLHWQDDRFWSVVTALPFRRPKEPLVFQKARPGESEPLRTLAARSRFETLTLPKPKDGS